MKVDIFVEDDFAKENNLVDYINAVAYELGLYGEGSFDTTICFEFNKKLENSKKFQTIILPLRDGISISIKL